MVLSMLIFDFSTLQRILHGTERHLFETASLGLTVNGTNLRARLRFPPRRRPPHAPGSTSIRLGTTIDVTRAMTSQGL